MKKLFLFVIVTVTCGILAKPLQQHIAKLEQAAALYAQNESKSWKRIAELNERISKLEQELFSAQKKAKYYY